MLRLILLNGFRIYVEEGLDLWESGVVGSMEPFAG